MPSPLITLAIQGLRTTQTMISQIVVSVSAAVSVAYVTNVYLQRDHAMPTKAPVVVEAAQPAAPEIAIAVPARSHAGPPPVAQAPAGFGSAPVTQVARAEPAALPPLAVQEIDTIPISAGLPARIGVASESGREVFPGVPADSAMAEAASEPAAADTRKRRRLFGLPIPLVADAVGGIVETVGIMRGPGPGGLSPR